MGHRTKPLRPGDNCPKCSAMLFPHCPDKRWPKGCDWVKCRKCGHYGTAKRFLRGAPDDDE